MDLTAIPESSGVLTGVMATVASHPILAASAFVFCLLNLRALPFAYTVRGPFQPRLSTLH